MNGRISVGISLVAVFLKLLFIGKRSIEGVQRYLGNVHFIAHAFERYRVGALLEVEGERSLIICIRIGELHGVPLQLALRIRTLLVSRSILCETHRAVLLLNIVERPCLEEVHVTRLRKRNFVIDVENTLDIGFSR